MALFIVLVLVLVLTVVITQMVFVTQVEKRISQNRQGFVQLNYALQASSRLVMQKVTEDLMEDLGLLEELDLEGGDMLGQVPDTNSNANAGPGGGGPDSAEEGESPSESNDAVDTRHDVWAYPIQDTVNDIQGAAPSAPDAKLWLGTDDPARDVLARVIYGFRMSVAFALVVSLLSSLLGIAAGAVQG